MTNETFCGKKHINLCTFVLSIFGQLLVGVMEIRGSFFMFVESGCISTNIEFRVP